MAFALKFWDTFDGETSTVDINSRPPTMSGLSWSVPTGQAYQPQVLTDGTVGRLWYGGAAVWSSSFADITGAWADDQRIEASGLSSTYRRFILRGSDSGSGLDGYTAQYSSGSGQWWISRIDAGTATNIFTLSAAAPSNTDTIAFEIVGTTLSLFQNGSLLGTAVDSTHATGAPGLSVQKTISSGGIDNFEAYDDAGAGGTTFFQTNTGSIAPTGALITQATFSQSLSGQSIPNGVLIRLIGKSLLGSVTPTGSVQKRIDKILDGSIAPIGTVATTIVVLVQLAGQVIATGILDALFIAGSGIVRAVQYMRGVIRGIIRSKDDEL